LKVAIIGTGYVGLSTGVGLAEFGHDVTCIDMDKDKIDLLKKGISPIYEPGIEEYLRKNINLKRLQFTTSTPDGLKEAEIIILAVGTPAMQDGRTDLSYLEKASLEISQYVEQETVIAIKSTVPVGTNARIKRIIENNKITLNPIHMVANPEFLKEGSALSDTLHPDRIVIGCETDFARKKMEELYKDFPCPLLFTSIESAEMIKYASNAFLAMKISFINAIGQLCEKTGGDIQEVAKGMGMDQRIGEHFLRAGIGFGGSCFPKDVQSLMKTFEDYHLDYSLFEATMNINQKQHLLLVEKALERFGSFAEKTFALWGLSFKPNTDDLREAPSLKIIEALLSRGAKVKAYDPVARKKAKEILEDKVTLTDSPEKAAENADAVFLVTEWEEFLNLPLQDILQAMNHPILFDGRNCLSEEKVLECERIEYYPVGRKPIMKGQE